VIGDSVTTIGVSAFSFVAEEKVVYYKGSATDWAKIVIEDRESNDDLINATRYYYSEEEPAEEGNWWHYDENGEIAVWEM